ncbi:MAG: sulfotransferase [Proteobacteria bacterium]|nr:sulfotransferase [Pseudomonadota bacterium]
MPGPVSRSILSARIDQTARVHVSLTQDEAHRQLKRADALLAGGRWGEAVSTYRTALRSLPLQADAWFNLGYALRRSGQFEDALSAYAQALHSGMREPEMAHLNRAAILSDHLRRDDEALHELRTALELAPGHPHATLNLGNLLEERADREQAADCYRRILDSARADVAVHRDEAMSRLLQLEPPGDPDDALFLRAREQAAPAPRSGGERARASLLFAIGRAYDGLDDVDGAFQAFRAGKQLAHRGHRPYDPARDRQRTLALIAASPAGNPLRLAAAAHTPEPLFICGMFRSGSTLLEQVLAAHPSITTCGELDLLPRIAAGPLSPYPASLATLDDERRAALSKGYLSDMLARLPEGGVAARYATDKRPDNYLLIGLIKRLFPGARIVHTLRHPLDNALSVYMQHLNPRAFDYAGSLPGIGHHYGEYRRLMAHWKALYPDDIFDFHYDDFVASPEATLRPLLAFLGLPWHENCLAFHRLGNTVKTASYWQVRRPLHGEASGRWRRYRVHLEPLQRAFAAQGIIVPETA